jgi:hypothetical protein
MSFQTAIIGCRIHQEHTLSIDKRAVDISGLLNAWNSHIYGGYHNNKNTSENRLFVNNFKRESEY